MGDLSEMRGLITVLSFLGVFVLFLAWIPPEMYTAGDFREVYTPEEFEAIEVYSFADYEVIYMNETSGHAWVADSTFWVYPFNVGNWDFDYYYKRPNQTGLALRMIHKHTEWWGLIPAFHGMELKDTGGVDRRTDNWLEVDAITANAESDGCTSRWRAVCQHCTLYMIFSYNNTLYYSFTNAWNMGELRVFWGINFEDVNTSYNAFQLVSMLLFWQFPEMSIYIQAPLSIPLWACICYLLYVLIIKVIPFIAGG